MKSIKATLNLVNKIVAKIRQTHKLDIALAGGYAVISHGVGRTTSDVDFYIYTDSIKENSNQLFQLINQNTPENFHIKIVEGSKMIGDPFPYDIIFLTDKTGEYPRIDFIVPRYKWELEAIQKAFPLEDLHFPVIPKPYLIAIKLRAAGPKDHYDIVELFKHLSEDEKKHTFQLATQIRRDKKLAHLINPPETTEEPVDDDLLI